MIILKTKHLFHITKSSWPKLDQYFPITANKIIIFKLIFFLNEIKLKIVKISISDLTFQNLMLRDMATSMAHSPRTNTL